MRPRLRPGLQVGRHRLVFHLGSGGEAEVWAAMPVGHRELKRVVAIKVLHATDDPGMEEIFLDEARAVAPLSHPAIVPVLDVGRSEHGLFIVMELVKGPNLNLVLRREGRLGRRLEPALVAWVGERLASALHHAWTAPGPGGVPLAIVHRDVSPQNVLVDRWGGVRLADFGAARSAIQRHRSMAGIAVGKPGYMAPEQVRGRAVDARTDLHAVGIVMHECATSRRTFHADDTRGLNRAVQREIPPRLTELIPDFPPRLSEVVARCLEKDPDARYPSAAALREALQAAAAELGGLDRARERFATRVNAEFPPEDFELELREDAPEQTAIMPRTGLWPGAPEAVLDPPMAASSPSPKPSVPGVSVRRMPPRVDPVMVVLALLIAGMAVILVSRRTPSETQAENSTLESTPSPETPEAAPEIAAAVTSTPAARTQTATAQGATPADTAPSEAPPADAPPVTPRAGRRAATAPRTAARAREPRPLTMTEAALRVRALAARDPTRGRALLLELNELDPEAPGALTRFEARLRAAEAAAP